MRKYYIGIKRNDEIIYVRDSVLLKSGPRRKDLPFVARVSGFWEEEHGESLGQTLLRTHLHEILRIFVCSPSKKEAKVLAVYYI